jgi:hypothetical protein
MNSARAQVQGGRLGSSLATVWLAAGAAVILAALVIAELNHASWQLMFYALFSIAFPICVAHVRISKFGVVDPAAVFLAFFTGYNGVLLLRIAVGVTAGDLRMPYPVQHHPETYTDAAFLSFLASASIGITLLMLSTRKRKEPTIDPDELDRVSSSAGIVGFLLAGLGLIFFFVNIIAIGGMRLALELPKIKRMELMKEAGTFFPYVPVFSAGLVLLALAFWRKRTRGSLIILLGAFGLWSMLSLLLGDRTGIAYAILSIVGLFAVLYDWKLSYKLVLGAVLVYMVFSVYSQVRWLIPKIGQGTMSAQQAKDWMQANGAADWILPENNEFAGPYYSVVDAAEVSPALRWGNSYADSLLFFLPQGLYPGKKPLPLANEFALEIHNRYATAYFPVSGWGYSPVAEAYVNFSWPGVVLVFAGWAWLFDSLEKFRWRSLTALLCVTMLLPQMQNANRINFLWVFTEGLFALAATLSAVWLCRLIAPGRVSAGRKRAARVATA